MTQTFRERLFLSGATADDLDARSLEEYPPTAVSRELAEKIKQDQERKLKVLGLLALDGTPTAAATLLFGVEPRYRFPGAYIQFVRFAGKKMTNPVANQIEIRGPIPSQLRESCTILDLNVMHALDTSGLTHVEIPDYPVIALREMLHNAVVHREYDVNSPVRLYWYSDRVEITSPGSLCGKVTRDNFGKGVTDYRNPTLAEVMKDMRLIRRRGEGIATAQRELEKNGNPPLEFEGLEDTFITAIIRKKE